MGQIEEIHTFSIIVTDNDLRVEDVTVPFENIRSNGTISLRDETIYATFKPKEISKVESYHVLIKVPKAKIQGVKVRIYLSEWEAISYLAIGYLVGDKTFQHIKVHHVLQGKWEAIDFNIRGVLYQNQNSWKSAEELEAEELKIYVKAVVSG